jgi:hypothetical protein
MRILILTFIAVLLSHVEPDNAPAGPHESASLSEIVLIGLMSPKELKIVNYPQARQTCVQKYLDAIPQNSFLWGFQVPSNAEEAVHTRKLNLVEQMVTICGENVRREAKTFAAALPLLAEWEGMSEGPLQEADFADQWVAKHPDSSIAQFLYLFKAHRLRAGYEAARAGHEKGLWPILAGRYRESIGKARSSTNPLLSCIATDLEQRAYVYLEGQEPP